MCIAIISGDISYAALFAILAFYNRYHADKLEDEHDK